MQKLTEKERSDIPEPSGVTIGALRIEALPWGKARGLGQNGGYIAAYDTTNGSEQWILKVYAVEYDTRKEDDKQDIFITELKLSGDGQTLNVTNEERKHFVVKLSDRSIMGKEPDAVP